MNLAVMPRVEVAVRRVGLSLSLTSDTTAN